MNETQYAQYGRLWTSSDGTRRRIYFPEEFLAALINLQYTTYKTGNISGATLDGHTIANGRASKLRSMLREGTVYYDCITQTLHVTLGEHTARMRSALENLAP